jgi:hypothetical protein
MSDFTLTSKSLKNSITLKEKNYQSFEHKSNIGIRNQLNNIHPFNLETTFGRVITDKNNEYEISFTCNDEESKCTDNTNKKILDFLERKEFIYFNYENFSKCETDNFSIAKSKKKSLDKKKGIIENNEFNDFNNNNINIWKILFLLLINFIFITIIFINKYINMKNRITFLVFINNK